MSMRDLLGSHCVACGRKISRVVRRDANGRLSELTHHHTCRERDYKEPAEPERSFVDRLEEAEAYQELIDG